MSERKPKRHIVRPFGMIGGHYEVDDAGALKYWLSWGITALWIGLLMLHDRLEIPAWALGMAVIATFGSTFALCTDVVRKGRKL